MSDVKPAAKIKNIKLVIEEDHNDVLRHIFRSVGSKLLPVTDNVLIHFDSHPDLGIPYGLTHEDTQDPDVLLTKLGIESWILPAAYMKIISTVIWVCPPWSHQIQEGHFKFEIGRNKLDDRINITCMEPYFLGEGLTSSPDQLDNVHEITLVVLKLVKNRRDLVTILRSLIPESSSVVLDIDLDFYSTKNPFLELFPRADVYSRLKKIYTFDTIPEGLSHAEKYQISLESSAKRHSVLEKTSHLLTYFQEHRSLDGYSGVGDDYVNAFNDIKAAILEHYPNESDIDWMILHNAGCTCDDNDLPHHISTDEEIESLIQDTKLIVHEVRSTIRLVTMARSSLDDFCPENQVDFIQTKAIDAIRDVFQDKIEIKLEYLNA